MAWPNARGAGRARRYHEPVEQIDDCVARTAEVIATKWTPQLLDQLAADPARFSDLQRAVPGISPRTLSARLRALEAAGIVQRPAGPYELTEMGRALLPIIEAMRAFGEQWQCAKPLREAA